MRPKKLLWLLIVLIIPALTQGQAQNTPTFSRGKVVEVEELGAGDFFGEKKILQRVHVKHLSSPQTISVLEPENTSIVTETQKFKKDDVVVLQEDINGISILEPFRLPAVLIFIGFFFLCVFLIGKKQGALASLGLLFSILVLAKFLIPQILNGMSPLLASLIACLLIASISMYLAHGFNRKTHLAILSILLVLFISFFLAFCTINATNLFGLGNEQSHFLFVGLDYQINLRGLLLGSIMLGTIGLLDDIATAQCATVEELSKANRKLSKKELFKRGSVVGREHIASMLNTLALAYAGTSLPFFLLIALNNDAPWWVILNTEFVAEEIIRTLVGSSALLLAVPISTALAAHFFSPRKD